MNLGVRKVIFILSFFIFYLNSFSQNAKVYGIVSDSISKETLIGVNIVLENGTGTATNIDGKYEIEVEPGTVSLLFRYIGFKEKIVAFSLVEGESKEFNIQLSASSTQLETMVVSAGKYEQRIEEITVSMEVIKTDLVEAKNTVNVQTIVEQVPGVHVTDEQVNIRGGSGFSYGVGSRVLVMVDGLPMLSADAGDIKWNFLPVENLEQIEIIKGASSVLYGSSALNGVMNIRTKYPRDKPETKINVFHGVYSDPIRVDSMGSRRDSLGELNKPLKWWDNTNPIYTGVNFYHSRQIKNLDLVIGGNGFNDEGYRQGETEQRVRLNTNLRYRVPNIDGLSVGVNVNSQVSKGGLFILWENADEGAYIPAGGLDTATTTISYFTTRRTNIDPFITYYNGKTKHSLRARYFNTTNKNDTEQEAIGDLYYGEYQISREFGKNLNITGGLVGSNSVVVSQLYGDHSGVNIAGYLQVDKRIKKRLNISGGLRAEYFKIDTTESKSNIALNIGDTLTFVKNSKAKPVFRLGANYKAMEYTYFRASFGQGYRFPSIAEKYVQTQLGPLTVYPNQTLRAESGWNAEIGVKQGLKLMNWKGFLDIAGFWTEYNDMIEFQFGVFNPDTTLFSYQRLGFKAYNVESAQIKGADISLVGEGEILGIKTTVFAGYTYMIPMSLNQDSAYKLTLSDTSSNMLKYRFKHLAKADISFTYKKMSTGFSVRYNSYMVNVDEILLAEVIVPGARDYREQHNGGTLVFDYRLAMQLSNKASVSLVVNNLLNNEYMGRPGDMQPPRTTALRYSISL
jgi:iron complex outermembrane receptor protein